MKKTYMIHFLLSTLLIGACELGAMEKETTKNMNPASPQKQLDKVTGVDSNAAKKGIQINDFRKQLEANGYKFDKKEYKRLDKFVSDNKTPLSIKARTLIDKKNLLNRNDEDLKTYRADFDAAAQSLTPLTGGKVRTDDEIKRDVRAALAKSKTTVYTPAHYTNIDTLIKKEADLKADVLKARGELESAQKEIDDAQNTIEIYTLFESMIQLYDQEDKGIIEKEDSEHSQNDSDEKSKKKDNKKNELFFQSKLRFFSKELEKHIQAIDAVADKTQPANKDETDAKTKFRIELGALATKDKSKELLERVQFVAGGNKKFIDLLDQTAQDKFSKLKVLAGQHYIYKRLAALQQQCEEGKEDYKTANKLLQHVSDLASRAKSEANQANIANNEDSLKICQLRIDLIELQNAEKAKTPVATKTPVENPQITGIKDKIKELENAIANRKEKNAKNDAEIKSYDHMKSVEELMVPFEAVMLRVPVKKEPTLDERLSIIEKTLKDACGSDKSSDTLSDKSGGDKVRPLKGENFVQFDPNNPEKGKEEFLKRFNDEKEKRFNSFDDMPIKGNTRGVYEVPNPTKELNVKAKNDAIDRDIQNLDLVNQNLKELETQKKGVEAIVDENDRRKALKKVENIYKNKNKEKENIIKRLESRGVQFDEYGDIRAAGLATNEKKPSRKKQFPEKLREESPEIIGASKSEMNKEKKTFDATPDYENDQNIIELKKKGDSTQEAMMKQFIQNIIKKSNNEDKENLKKEYKKYFKNYLSEEQYSDDKYINLKINEILQETKFDKGMKELKETTQESEERLKKEIQFKKDIEQYDKEKNTDKISYDQHVQERYIEIFKNDLEKGGKNKDENYIKEDIAKILVKELDQSMNPYEK